MDKIVFLILIYRKKGYCLGHSFFKSGITELQFLDFNIDKFYNTL